MSESIVQLYLKNTDQERLEFDALNKPINSFKILNINLPIVNNINDGFNTSKLHFYDAITASKIEYVFNNTFINNINELITLLNSTSTLWIFSLKVGTSNKLSCAIAGGGFFYIDTATTKYSNNKFIQMLGAGQQNMMAVDGSVYTKINFDHPVNLFPYYTNLYIKSDFLEDRYFTEKNIAFNAIVPIKQPLDNSSSCINIKLNQKQYYIPALKTNTSSVYKKNLKFYVYLFNEYVLYPAQTSTAYSSNYNRNVQLMKYIDNANIHITILID